MSRVSLILPTTKGDPRPDALVPSLRSALEDAGHDVEVIVVCEPASTSHDGFRIVVSQHPGLASAAMAGLEDANGEILVVLDPRMGYDPENLPAIVDPLEKGEATVAIASRYLPTKAGSWWRTLIGKFARPFTGTTDPLSGLIGLTRSALDAGSSEFRAVGDRYSLEFLSKIRGKRVDVSAMVDASARRGLPGWDELRHLKRLADHQYGNASRLIQFCVVGASGMVVDLSCYFVFQKLFNQTGLAEYSLPTSSTSTLNMALATARASAIAVALVWNFSLNRRLTFSYARKGSIIRQFAIYVASNMLGVLVSMTLSLGLPERFEFFRDHKLMAAVVGIVAATGISFSMSRWVVFRPKAGELHANGEAIATPEPTEVPAPQSGRA